ncbi:hypothetical protein EVAR_60416_1 [Eumeta japonica]|uniref:Uncharacterized protein n=1 Tax=Eumeta variegata TaxID=151549 RepID=A0A4C1ZKT4_EUMVA|nr:hypothetical protein EVAR_60416_1 [Eumeta japonica]
MRACVRACCVRACVDAWLRAPARKDYVGKRRHLEELFIQKMWLSREGTLEKAAGPRVYILNDEQLFDKNR